MKRYWKSVLIGLVIAVFLASVSYTSVHVLPQYLTKPAKVHKVRIIPTVTPTATPYPIKPTSVPVIKATPTPEVQQIGEHTFVGAIPCDTTEGSAMDVYGALNDYRLAHGAAAIAWSDKLAAVANMRTAQIVAGGGYSDNHAGFTAFTSDQSNYAKVGFNVLSENIGGGGNCVMSGKTIIEKLFGRDAPHNNAQLDHWDAVGISVNGTIVGLIFGRGTL